MIIGFFRDNQPLTYIVLFVLAVLLWAGAWTHIPYVSVAYKMPLFDVVTNAINLRSHFMIGFTVTVILATGLVLNYTVNTYDLLTKHSTLPVLLYVVLMSSTSTLMTLHPLVLANFFIALAFNRVASVYRRENSFTQLFDAGLLVGIASLFHFPALLIYLSLFMALIIFSTFNWREWVVTFFGVLTPYLFVFAYYFYYDKLSVFWQYKIVYPIRLTNEISSSDGSTYTLLAILFFICVFAIVKLFDEYSSYTIKIRQTLSYLLWVALFGFMAVFVSPTWTFKDFALLAIPFSVFISNYFINITREWMAETLFILLLSCTLFIHYF